MADDEDFDQIVAGLQFEEPSSDVIPEYREMELQQLLHELHEVKKWLIVRDALLAPKTDEEKDRHAIYFGLVSEARRRKLM